MMRGPTSVVTSNATSPLSSWTQFFQPWYSTFFTVTVSVAAAVAWVNRSGSSARPPTPPAPAGGKLIAGE